MAAVMASCSQDEIVEVKEYTPISFGNVFVDKSTRATDPSHTTSTLEKFYVYGNVKGKNESELVSIYNGACIEKTKIGETNNYYWNSGSNIYYWVPNCDYNFVAVSDVEANNITVTQGEDGLPSKIEYSYDAGSQVDLLYAKKTDIKTDSDGKPDNTNEYGEVSFTFEHLLAKVKFSFTNSFPENSNVNLTVQNIQINNAAKTAEYVKDENGDWSWTVTESFAGSEESTDNCISFGNTERMAPNETKEGEYIRFLVPETNKDFNITLTVLYELAGTSHSVNLEAKNVTLEKGHFYNFTAELTSNNVTGIVPIIFNITKDEWSDIDNTDYPVGPLYN